MASNTLVLYAMWGTLSATFGAWLVTLAQLIWVANERAKVDVQVCGQDRITRSLWVSPCITMPVCSYGKVIWLAVPRTAKRQHAVI